MEAKKSFKVEMSLMLTLVMIAFFFLKNFFKLFILFAKHKLVERFLFSNVFLSVLEKLNKFTGA